MSYADVIKCASGEILQIFRRGTGAEIARTKFSTVTEKGRQNRFSENP